METGDLWMQDGNLNRDRECISLMDHGLFAINCQDPILLYNVSTTHSIKQTSGLQDGTEKCKH